jgi:hypothetical protein
VGGRRHGFRSISVTTIRHCSGRTRFDQEIIRAFRSAYPVHDVHQNQIGGAKHRQSRSIPRLTLRSPPRQSHRSVARLRSSRAEHFLVVDDENPDRITGAHLLQPVARGGPPSTLR